MNKNYSNPNKPSNFRSLLEHGYESDTNLIFHKREIEENDLDKYLNDYEKRQSYKRMQIGGEPPLLGFRKPAPEKQKGKRFLIIFLTIRTHGEQFIVKIAKN